MDASQRKPVAQTVSLLGGKGVQGGFDIGGLPAEKEERKIGLVVVQRGRCSFKQMMAKWYKEAFAMETIPCEGPVQRHRQNPERQYAPQSGSAP